MQVWTEGQWGSSKYEGKVLEIQKDLLANFFDQLQEKKEDNSWSHEKTLVGDMWPESQTGLGTCSTHQGHGPHELLVGKYLPDAAESSESSWTADLQNQRSRCDQVRAPCWKGLWCRGRITITRLQLKARSRALQSCLKLESSLKFKRVQAQMLGERKATQQAGGRSLQSEGGGSGSAGKGPGFPWTPAGAEHQEGRSRSDSEKGTRPAGDRASPLAAGETKRASCGAQLDEEIQRSKRETMHQVAGGQVSPPSGPKTPQEDSAGEGAWMEKDQELHEVPAGRSLEPDHKKGEEVVQHAFPPAPELHAKK